MKLPIVRQPTPAEKKLEEALKARGLKPKEKKKK
jgi:hypothetical protein